MTRNPEHARGMFLRLVWRAILLRRRRMALALIALTVGATLASALLTTYADLDKKMGGELRDFGANLVVTPAGDTEGATLAESQLAGVEAQVPSLPMLYVVGEVNGEAAVLAGTRFDRLESFARAWHWQGRAPRAVGECAVGERLAGRFLVGPGSVLKAAYGQDAIDLQVTGVVATGASEDSQLLMPLDSLQTLVGMPGRVSLVQVLAPGSGAELEATRQKLAASAGTPPAFEVRALRQVAESSARILLKVKWTLFAVTGLVLTIIGLGVMTTQSAIVLERRRDIAVMKAIGGAQSRISALFLTESALLALIGGAFGYTAGIVLARVLGSALFSSPVMIRPAVLPEVMLVTLAVALVATLFPLRVVRRLEPAVILKGE